MQDRHDNALEALRAKKGFIIDMDGVIYRGKELIPGAQPFVTHLRENDIPFLFLTNNSSRGVEDYIEKLRAMGIETAREDYVTSVDAAIRHRRRSSRAACGTARFRSPRRSAPADRCRRSVSRRS